MYNQQTSRQIKTLNELNQILAPLPNISNYPLGGLILASFTPPPNVRPPRTGDVDKAIVQADDQIFNWMDVNDLINSINDQLGTLMTPPNGYTYKTIMGFDAYVNEGGYVINQQVLDKLVQAANNVSSAIHKSDRVKNVPTQTNGYVHITGSSTLYAFKKGTHKDGIAMIQVLGEGHVDKNNYHVF